MWKFLLLVGFFVISIDSQMTKVTTGPMVKTTVAIKSSTTTPSKTTPPSSSTSTSQATTLSPTTSSITTTAPKVCCDLFPRFCKTIHSCRSYRARKYCPKTCGRCRPVTKKPCKNRWGYWCQYYRNYCNYYKVRKNCRKTCRRCH
ncbi:uncharacterized protein [Lepeophtheirus salmonis]|uniref:uncharacterized protein n=1 Tax=Lepeophtheirus salmonis TaxID=72036 RepID=UPI001AE2F1A5|nr:uncharacterized protein ZK673.1-like [Lepeophtheirus salmonis]